jgi:hypothetical protein
MVFAELLDQAILSEACDEWRIGGNNHHVSAESPASIDLTHQHFATVKIYPADAFQDQDSDELLRSLQKYATKLFVDKICGAEEYRAVKPNDDADGTFGQREKFCVAEPATL